MPGVRLNDTFADRLVRKAGTVPVEWIALPPGRDGDFALLRLTSSLATRDAFLVCVLPKLLCGNPTAALLAGIASALSIPESSSADAGSLTFTAAPTCIFPRLWIVAVHGRCELAALRDMRRLCDDLYELTRDLAGPWRFIVLRQVAGLEDIPEAQSWDGCEANAEALPFGSGAPALEHAALNVHLGFRIWWECAGQPDEIARTLVAVAGAAIRESLDPDEMLWAALRERSPASGGLDTEALRSFFDGLDRGSTQTLLASAIVPADRSRRLAAFAHAGVLWRPPGSLHWWLTVAAARAVETCPRLRDSLGINVEQGSRLVSAARTNLPLSSWVRGLTEIVEHELLARCRANPDIERVIVREGFVEELTELRSRSRRQDRGNEGLPLVEFAGFYHLQRLVLAGRTGRALPLSPTRLNAIRDLRNLVAHLHPVTWKQVRSVILALAELQG